MTDETKHYLYELSAGQQTKTDPAHDFEHVKRVVDTALFIAKSEGDINDPSTWSDQDIILAAALFHDSVMYRKGTPENKNSTEESALLAERLLRYSDFPEHKVSAVLTCIRECSFSKGLTPSTIESKIVADADMLDAAGAIGIMRTFSYGGMTNRPLYTPHDPFCRSSEPQKMRSGIDHFYDRLRLVAGRMNTQTGKRLVKRRTEFLDVFLAELEAELEEIRAQHK